MQHDPSLPVVVALSSDLFFTVRIEDAVRAVGGRPVVASDAHALAQALEARPALVLIDLSAAPGWDAVVRRAKSGPGAQAILIVAFGSHVDTAGLQAARAAGCDHAWARSHFFAELPSLLQATVHVSVRQIEGCDETPPPALLDAVEQFNAGQYWACHETLEALWRAEPRARRDLYQGILQIGVALHHLAAGNTNGALKLFDRGLRRLQGVPDVCQGIHVGALVRSAGALHNRLVDLGKERAGEMAPDAWPTISTQ